MARRSYNAYLADRAAERGVTLLRYDAQLRAEVLGQLRLLEEALVERLRGLGLTRSARFRFELMLRDVREEIAGAYGLIAQHVEDSLAAVASLESRFYVQLIGQPLAFVDRTASLLSLPQLRAIASGALIDGAPNRDWWESQEQDLVRSFTREMRQGIGLGETIDELVRRLRGTATGVRNTYEINGERRTYVQFKGGLMDTSTRNARALVRTAVASVSADARRTTFEENQDVVEGVVQISTLDGRTTDVCIAYGGKAWRLPDYEPIGHHLPYNGGTPRHWGCRSQESPLLKSWEALGIDARDVPQGKRWSRMDGKVPADFTMDDFLDRRTAAQLDDILGPGRAELYRAGKIDATALVDGTGRPLSLAELERRYGSAA